MAAASTAAKHVSGQHDKNDPSKGFFLWPRNLLDLLEAGKAVVLSRSTVEAAIWTATGASRGARCGCRLIALCRWLRCRRMTGSFRPCLAALSTRRVVAEPCMTLVMLGRSGATSDLPT